MVIRSIPEILEFLIQQNLDQIDSGVSKVYTHYEYLKNIAYEYSLI